ncbi:uncharacterized protein E0L32_011853 [Thyridium curvatum]|uniref:Impact N-terminal domain-containing protein n=1 Tax=Thyridium curvatum TaxID=1093900 RepID=A0A507BF35_9PEZI|nr:uncharacterized protein E0L32_011853 [Thyridium curvatum]TPX18083.1 hypothetical protein E0L32_011853 [Thyridium curvatum]
MATQQDLQELLRLLTVTRKVPMMQAMAHIKALQGVNLRRASIKQIAEAPQPDVESAIKDAKAARALQNACKAAVKLGVTGGKRPAAAGATSGAAAKRAKLGDGDGGMGGPAQMTPQELERSLELPLCTDEEMIAGTVLQTNRAPLVLAFAVELLRYTMPEQPLSSRLSLAQAVVSANSRSKAVSIGIEKGPSAEEEGYGEGQPRVRVMGREVAVLKRGGYKWKGDEEVGEGADQAKETQETSTTSVVLDTPTPTWSVSQPVTLKSSTFVARAAAITDASQRSKMLADLMAANPKLQTATHNAWAYRIKLYSGASFMREDSFDDGEAGCGDLLLRVMREVSAVDTIVVLTRWYGGIMLGPDRWRLMRDCATGALAGRLRKTGAEVSLGGEAVWGLDLEAARNRPSGIGGGGGGYGSSRNETSVVGMHIHRPEAARSYLLRSFASATPEPTAAAPADAGGGGGGDGDGGGAKAKKGATPKKKTQKALDAEKEENLGLLLGAIRLVFDSWADHLAPADLDRRAWSWYTAVRPDVDSGPSGWGAKGSLKLKTILDLRRKED